MVQQRIVNSPSFFIRRVLVKAKLRVCVMGIVYILYIAPLHLISKQYTYTTTTFTFSGFDEVD